MADDNLDVSMDLEGGMKWSYEQFHILSLVLQQRIMVSKGSFPVREAMIDHQWYSIPKKNKESFLELWKEIEEKRPKEGQTIQKQDRVDYERLCEKAQLISDLLLEIHVINYAVPSEAVKIIERGMERQKDIEEGESTETEWEREFFEGE